MCSIRSRVWLIVAAIVVVACAPLTTFDLQPTPLKSPQPTEVPGTTLAPAPQAKPTSVIDATLPVSTPIPFRPVKPTNTIPGDNPQMTGTIEPGMQPLINQAINDLATRLALAPDAIEVVSAQSVVWPDSSLGCPQPGMNYLQVLSEGYRIELRAQGRLYDYHGGGRRGPFLCESH